MNIQEEIIKALKKNGAKGNIDAKTQFSNIGIDSLDLMDMVVGLEDKLSIRIPDDKLLDIKTVGDLIKVIEELKK